MEEKVLETRSDLFEFAAFDEHDSEHIAAPQYSYWKSVWRTFIKNKFTVAVSIVMIILVLFALIQPSISGYDPLIAPNVTNPEMRFLRPSAEHIFGTDNVGNEVFGMVAKENAKTVGILRVRESRQGARADRTARLPSYARLLPSSIRG